MKPIVSMAAILSADGFISRETGVPWDLPIDREHYRAYTKGKWVLVGRTTFEEALGWFDDRYPLVMSRDAHFKPQIGERVRDVAEALARAEAANVAELVVIGGGGVFAAAMPYADRLVITHVDDVLGGGVPFPKMEAGAWKTVSRTKHPRDARHAHAFEIVVYERAPAHHSRAPWT